MLRSAVKAAVLAVVVYKVLLTVVSFGVFSHYKKHYPGECRQVEGIGYGSEDLQVTKDGLAFITSGIWLPSIDNFIITNRVQGGIYLYDFNQPDLGAVKLKLKPSKNFNPEAIRPHGISVLEDENRGEHLVYVISHLPQFDTVEKFKYSPKTKELVHLKTFTSSKFHVTNDLAVTGEDTFYITNYLYFKNSILSAVEQLLLFVPFGLGSVVYFNGSEFSIVESWAFSPNGIFLSKDKRYLYVNYPLTGDIKVYERREDNSITQVQSVALHTTADNLHNAQSWDALYTGAHPVAYKIFQHASDPTKQSPSSVLRLPLVDGKIVSENITELFYDHGDLISGSSVAAVYNNKLLIGSIIHKLVICDVSINK